MSTQLDLAVKAQGSDVSKAELFRDLFMADEGALRKWSKPIGILVDGEEPYVKAARRVIDFYATEFGIQIQYREIDVDLYIINTSDLFKTLLVHGEAIFVDAFDGKAELYDFLKSAAEKDRGYVVQNRFRGHEPTDSVIVLEVTRFGVENAEQVLNTLIVNALLPGKRKKTESNAKSVFFSAAPVGQLDDLDRQLISEYVRPELEQGISWAQVRKSLRF